MSAFLLSTAVYCEQIEKAAVLPSFASCGDTCRHRVVGGTPRYVSYMYMDGDDGDATARATKARLQQSAAHAWHVHVHTLPTRASKFARLESYDHDGGLTSGRNLICQ